LGGPEIQHLEKGRVWRPKRANKQQTNNQKGSSSIMKKGETEGGKHFSSVITPLRKTLGRSSLRGGLKYTRLTGGKDLAEN